MTVYQHFREEEHPFINQVLSWKELVERTYVHKLSDLLDPREQQVIEMLIGTANEDLQLKLYGGGNYTERKRIIIAPYYEELKEEDFQLTLMSASYNSKFLSLSHRDVMGAFLSLGIKRSKLGDIFVTDNEIQIIMAKDIASYVAANLTKIKNANIQLTEQSFSDLLEKETNWIETDKTVSSLRLDVVLRDIYQISRKDATSHIARKHVKVNFKLVDNVTFNLLEGDLISLRGKGRSKLVQVNGLSRKNKFRITTAILT